MSNHQGDWKKTTPVYLEASGKAYSKYIRDRGQQSTGAKGQKACTGLLGEASPKLNLCFQQEKNQLNSTRSGADIDTKRSETITTKQLLPIPGQRSEKIRELDCRRPAGGVEMNAAGCTKLTSPTNREQTASPQIFRVAFQL